jgi:hypothetical protein
VHLKAAGIEFHRRNRRRPRCAPPIQGLIVAFYLPGDFFGWVDAKLSLSIEAATDTEAAVYQTQGLAFR